MKSSAKDRLPRKAQTAVVERASPPVAPAPCRLVTLSPCHLVTPWPRLLTAATATALLLWLCYFPVAWGWLGWVALVPLLTLVRSTARPRAIYLAAWLCGLG